MKRSGAAEVVRALEDEAIPFTFGIPGTHNIELYDALAGSEVVRPVLVADEQGSGFMADGVWRASGRLGCVNVVPGAGLTHALSGIAEAYLDTVPMLVLGCGIRRDTDRAYQLHDVDQAGIVGPVTKAQLRPETGADIYAAVRRACRLAREGPPGPVFVEIPADHYLVRHEPAPDGPALEPRRVEERPSVVRDPAGPAPD
ncbi:MAG TPA: thiamine pyrophosphate-binding protein, partial [Longimicrobiales bacterium]|nr:thiamine pyrophosphate-binding protein [Longimicrobiales bacterium]